MKWLTNLESDALILATLKHAEDAHEADPTPLTLGALQTAKIMSDLHEKAKRNLEQQFGPLVFAEPQATKTRTAEAIAADGYMGVYYRKIA